MSQQGSSIAPTQNLLGNLWGQGKNANAGPLLHKLWCGSFYTQCAVKSHRSDAQEAGSAPTAPVSPGHMDGRDPLYCSSVKQEVCMVGWAVYSVLCSSCASYGGPHLKSPTLYRLPWRTTLSLLNFAHPPPLPKLTLFFYLNAIYSHPLQIHTCKILNNDQLCKQIVKQWYIATEKPYTHLKGREDWSLYEFNGWSAPSELEGNVCISSFKTSPLLLSRMNWKTSYKAPPLITLSPKRRFLYSKTWYIHVLRLLGLARTLTLWNLQKWIMQLYLLKVYILIALEKKN